MGRGKRYSSEPKLNIKKVIAVALVIAVIVMFVIAIKNSGDCIAEANSVRTVTVFI